jgi:mannose-6-phosphate isomerase
MAQRLHPDNFTPPQRTPWGGSKIGANYKAGLGLSDVQSKVGESWEISVEPTFPSRLVESGELLSEAIAQDPVAWLGAEIAHRHGGQTPLLVKLLDSADNLSVQVHPSGDDPKLGPGESGKPEGWVVLEAEPGGGLYLGFRPGVGASEVAACIDEGGALDELMNFVPVERGDAFVIAAGTPHAIGRGVTLVEPQWVAPGSSGVTYRFWDWNRRYNAAGDLDPTGKPRELHLARSLEVTTFLGAGDIPLSESCRFESVPLARAEWEFHRSVALECPAFVLERWQGSGQRLFKPFGTMVTLTCVKGRARLESSSGALNLRMGESAVVPAAEGEFTLYLYRGEIFSCRSNV